MLVRLGNRVRRSINLHHGKISRPSYRYVGGNQIADRRLLVNIHSFSSDVNNRTVDTKVTSSDSNSVGTTTTASSAVGPWQASTGYSWLDSVLGLNDKESLNIRQSYALFDHCVAPAKTASFFSVFGIPRGDTREWLAYHNVIGLHVWLIYKRLKAQEILINEGGASGDAAVFKTLGQELYDRFWEDSLERVRETKVFEIMVNKHLKTAQEVTYTANVELDQAIAITDDQDAEFGGAIWRFLYRSDETIPEKDVERLVKYTRHQHSKIFDMPIEKVLNLEFEWNKPIIYQKKQPRKKKNMNTHNKNK